MFGNEIIGSFLYGSQSTGGEMTFTPISKNTTYLQIMDMVKIQTGCMKNPLVSDSLIIKQISVSQQNIQLRTPEIQYLYRYTYEGLSITGTSNPYKCDLSAINPYIVKPELFVHITAAGVRTHVEDMDAEKGENLSELSLYDTSLLGSYRGDTLQLYKGASFTITIADDTIDFNFIRQTIASSVTSASYIDLPDSLIQTLVTDVSTEIMKYNK